MAGEIDAMKLQLASSKAAMLQAMTLIDRLDKPAAPAIDPAEIVNETAGMKTVTDALLAKVAAHTPADPPVVPST